MAVVQGRLHQYLSVKKNFSFEIDNRNGEKVSISKLADDSF
jgi:hypothetical protein